MWNVLYLPWYGVGYRRCIPRISSANCNGHFINFETIQSMWMYTYRELAFISSKLSSIYAVISKSNPYICLYSNSSSEHYHRPAFPTKQPRNNHISQTFISWHDKNNASLPRSVKIKKWENHSVMPQYFFSSILSYIWPPRDLLADLVYNSSAYTYAYGTTHSKSRMRFPKSKT